MNNYREEDDEVEVVPNSWSSELPTDLLGLITVKILSSFAIPEFIRFGCVCVEWRSFTIDNYQHIKLPDKVPVLLIPIPPSLMLTDHHQKENYEEEEEVDEEEKVLKEEVVVEEVINEREEEEVVVEEEEAEVQDDDDNEDDDIDDEDDDDDDDIDDDDEEEEEEEEEVKVQRENYYSPNGIWKGLDAKQHHKNTRTFYSLSEKRVYHDFQLPVPYYKNVVGSSYGWLVTVQECYADNGQLYLPVGLLNPFRTDNNEIQLPTFVNTFVNGYPESFSNSYFLRKAYLSANPSSLSDPTTQLVVLGVYGCNRLAFCRPGDQTWTRLDLEDYRPIQDIICYKGEFYAVLQSGYVFAFVFDAAQPLPTPIVTRAFSPPPSLSVTLQRYLVESEGDLLQVGRHIGRPTPAESGRPISKENIYITRQCTVLKLDPLGQWVEMKTLNNRMLLIGQSSSMSLSASDFPGWSRPNSIYYTDDFNVCYSTTSQYGPHDIGIFNLEDGSFEPHYEAESKTIMPPPIWIQPML